MTFESDGAERHCNLLDASTLATLRDCLDGAIHGRAGARLASWPELRSYLCPIDAIAEAKLGPGTRPVRAMLFDKTERTNWSLAWHQDRTIAVKKRADVPGFGGWTRKHGIHHVNPPLPILERMLTVRVHLDPVREDNAPLLVAPGSHRGFVPESAIPAMVDACGTRICTAEAGDIWVYASLILHASERSRAPARRRVLQLFYSADELPRPLCWLGI
jgi:ectoine hydroxylase-related dioxygenase (phytanoyl-CoA dioxygenase family)